MCHFILSIIRDLKNRTVVIIATSILLSFLSYKSYAQLSIQIDSVKLDLISDYPQKFLNKTLYSEGYEKALLFGPYIYVCGKLVNSSSKAIVYDASSGSTALTKPMIKTIFRYKGRIYETECCPIGMLDSFGPVSGESEYANVSCNHIGDKDVWMYYIPGNASVPISFGSAFLYNSKWCKLREKHSIAEIDERDKRNIRELEKIAKEVLPTVQVSISVKNHWDAWSEFLVEGNHICE